MKSRGSLLRHYSDLPVHRREILRYAGMPVPTPEVQAVLDACIEEAAPHIHGRVVFGVFPLVGEQVPPAIRAATDTSKDLRRALDGCGEVILLAATVGLELDRLIAAAEVRSPLRALLISSFGSQQAEAVCDSLEEELRGEGFALRPRFSPGYGDLPLSLQGELLALLDAPRRVGISLREGLLMSPTKSVTALIGIKTDT